MNDSGFSFIWDFRSSLTARAPVTIKCPGGATNSPRRDHLRYQAMIKFRPLPPLERLNELLEVVEIPPNKYGEWSGLVWKINRRGKAKAGSVAGSPQPCRHRPGRADWTVRVDNIQYGVSRIIYYMTRGEDPGDIQVDHEDQNSLNNNGWNLRLDVDGSIQKINFPKQQNNTSGVVGVHWNKATGKWQAEVRPKSTRKYLGLYTCKVEAARVVRNKWIELGWHELGRELPNLDKVQCNCSRCSTNS
jgi:hypothetical protein